MMADGGDELGVGESRSANAVLGIVAWLVGLLFFFPVFWTVLNSFKDEQDANTSPRLLFDLTFDRYGDVTESTAACCRSARRSRTRRDRRREHDHRAAAGDPGRIRAGDQPIEKWRDVLFFFISTKFLPVVASILPIWILARESDAEHAARCS